VFPAGTGLGLGLGFGLGFGLGLGLGFGLGFGLGLGLGRGLALGLATAARVGDGDGLTAAGDGATERTAAGLGEVAAGEGDAAADASGDGESLASAVTDGVDDPPQAAAASRSRPAPVSAAPRCRRDISGSAPGYRWTTRTVRPVGTGAQWAVGPRTWPANWCGRM
jgi:hypothetical protein